LRSRSHQEAHHYPALWEKDIVTTTKAPVCAHCENDINPGQPRKMEPFTSPYGKMENFPVHEHCAWMKGVQALVRALWGALQQKRAIDLRAKGVR